MCEVASAFMNGERVRLAYLDHAATTPMRETAIAAMAPYLADQFANPSGSHRFSRSARTAIDEARDDVAEVLGCAPGEVVFTSGGTEGDNAAIFGAVRRHGGVAVCSAAEHHAVLHCVEHLGGVVVAVDKHGVINVDELQLALDNVASRGERVAVVSVMAVNNEVGTITNMEEVSRIVRRYAPTAILHTDAVQGACWVDLAHLVSLVDILTLSSHKFGGPKGSGIMYLRNGVHLEPLIFGGGQERDRRSGTHNVAGIAATTAALTATATERHSENLRVMELKEQLLAGLHNIGGVHQTVPNEVSVPGIVHVCVEGVENEALLFLLDEEHLCASAASACASGAMEPSHVLAAMGVPRERAQGALRLSLGHSTTSGDIVQALGTLGRAVARLREHQRS